MWDSFLTYLLIEKKLNILPNSDNERVVRNRFKALCYHFATTEFNRENLGLFLLEKKREGYANSYLNNFIKTARQLQGFLLLRYKYDAGLAEYTYFKEEQKLVDPLSPQEIKALAEVYIPYRYNQNETNAKYRALIYTLALTGGRINEVLTLHKNQVFTTHVVIYGSKVGEERLIPISPFLHNLLLEQIKHSDCDLVFSENGHQLSDQSINKDLKKRADAIGLKKNVYNHLFRHSLVVQLLREGVSVVHIQKILGHKSLDSIQNYSHLILEDLTLAMMQHPLVRKEQTLNSVSTKLKEYIERMVSKDLFTCTIQDGREKFSFMIETLDKKKNT